VIESNYNGARTQKIDEVQSIAFHQVATLLTPAGGPMPSRLYEFTQEVKDSFESVTAAGTPGSSSALGEFEKDGPFGPPYDSEMITEGANAIVFTDDPGFSTDRRIPKGDWLTKWDVYFRWKVKRLTDGKQWTSDIVHHSITCGYNGGAEVKINHNAAGDLEWTVKFA
jgi:hypothetical protein